MKKKLYIQPTTDFVRMTKGESLMRDLAGSGEMGETAPSRIVSNAPMHKINIMYI